MRTSYQHNIDGESPFPTLLGFNQAPVFPDFAGPQQTPADVVDEDDFDLEAMYRDLGVGD